MREVRPPESELPLETASFLACLATILELPFDQMPLPPSGESLATGWTVSRWLGGLGLGLARVADPGSFTWAGPWIGRADGRFVVMYGVPSGVVWDPAGRGEIERESIEDGFLIPTTPIALAMPPRHTAPPAVGTVETIAVAGAAGEPARLLQSVHALAGQGLDGRSPRRRHRHVSLGAAGQRADDDRGRGVQVVRTTARARRASPQRDHAGHRPERARRPRLPHRGRPVPRHAAVRAVHGRTAVRRTARAPAARPPWRPARGHPARRKHPRWRFGSGGAAGHGRPAERSQGRCRRQPRTNPDSGKRAASGTRSGPATAPPSRRSRASRGDGPPPRSRRRPARGSWRSPRRGPRGRDPA